ncbi:MAG: Rhodoferax phage [Pseudomonadota bacterium]|jgi:hypothetical protein
MADKIKMSAIREQFPMYGDLSDDDLAMAIRQKYYPDIPAQRFYSNIDFDTKAAKPAVKRDVTPDWQAQAIASMTLDDKPWYERAAIGAGSRVNDLVQTAKNLFTEPSTQESITTKAGNAMRDKDSAAFWGGVGSDLALTAVPGYRAQQGITGAVRAGSILLPKATQAVVRGAAPYVGAVGSGALVGASMSPEDMAGGAQTGALAGAAGEVGGRVLGATYNGAKAVLDPLTEKGRDRILKRTIDRFATDPTKVRAAAANPQVFVPGVTPTLAEATGDVGIAQLQRGAQATSPDVASALAESRARQVAGYRGALDDMAGNDGKREFYDSARDWAAQQEYGRAWAGGLKSTPQLDATAAELMKRPSVQSAITEARTLALEKGVDITGQEGSVMGLHYIKRALDDKISAANRAGNGNMADALKDTKDQLVSYLTEASPAYGEALNTYRAMSRPINQMDVAQTLRDKAIPALSDFSEGSLARVNANSYANALRNADTTARQATGMQGAKLANIMEPAQMQTIEGIGKDMARYATSQEAGRVAGSPTAQYLGAQNVLRQFMGPLGLPQSAADSMLGRVAAGLLDLPFKMTQSQTEQLLARALTDPKVAAKILAAKDPKTIADLLRPFAAQAAIQIDTQ